MGRLASAALVFVTAAAGSAGAAAADDLRYPQSGPVAFLLHLPNGWNAKLDDSGNMLVVAPDRSAVLSLTVAKEDAATLKQTPDQFANTLLAFAKAEPFNKHEKGAIAGLPADTYYSRIVSASNVKATVKMNLIKPVHDYIVSETILTIAAITSAQQAALAAALKGITLLGAK